MTDKEVQFICDAKFAYESIKPFSIGDKVAFHDYNLGSQSTGIIVGIEDTASRNFGRMLRYHISTEIEEIVVVGVNRIEPLSGNRATLGLIRPAYWVAPIRPAHDGRH